MKVEQTKIKTKCDVVGCRELATNTLYNEQLKVAFSLCEKCVKEMYACLGQLVKPGFVPAPYNTNRMKRSKNEK